MKRYLLFFVSLFMMVALSYGQGEIDALRYSRNDITGTARSMGMGGSFGALGGDVSAVAINPGGIGIYRSSEVVGTMNFSSNNITTDWGNGTLKDSKFKFNFDNLAYMGYFPTGNNTFKCFNVGFTFNRLKNYDRNYKAKGSNMSSSLTDYAAGVTDGINVDKLINDMTWANSNEWMSMLFWDAGLIKTESGNPNLYESNFGNKGTPVNPEISVSETGAIDSYDFSFGTNISDILSFGLTFSITDINYYMSSNYSEKLYNGESEFRLNNYLETNGAGYQVSTGVIFRPTDALRLGVAYHSPTWYNMTDYFQGTTIYNKSTTSTPNELGRGDYRFQSPYRWVFSAAGIIGSKAVVNLDYEITDYKSMNLEEPDGYDYKEDNNFIDQDFKMTSTLRAGIEVRATPQLSLRAGYAWMQNPYEKTFKNGDKRVVTVGTIPHFTIEGDANYFTFGLGYRFTRNFFVDAAFVYRTQTDDLYAFSKLFYKDNGAVYVDSTPAKFTNNTYKGVVTLGYKF